MPDDPIPSWSGFLRIEADLALTFISLARCRLRPEDSARSLENARKALAQIERCLMDPPHYGISEIDLVFLKQRCMVIDLAFQDFGSGKQI
jgi:hypothetical protein